MVNPDDIDRFVGKPVRIRCKEHERIWHHYGTLKRVTTANLVLQCLDDEHSVPLNVVEEVAEEEL